MCLSQKDKRWADLTIMPGMTLSKFGCFTVCLSIISGRTPDQGLYILKTHNCYNHEGGLLHPNDAIALGLKYDGWKEVKLPYPTSLCILETNYYAKKGYNQHFVLWLGDGTICDVLDGQIKENIYKENMVSFRQYSNPRDLLNG